MNLDEFDFGSSPIQTIKKGHKVVTRNPDTGKTELKQVTRTFKRTAYEIVNLQLADAKTGALVDTIKGTPEHPFFVPEGGMVPMGELKPVMKVIVAVQISLLRYSESILFGRWSHAPHSCCCRR